MFPAFYNNTSNNMDLIMESTTKDLALVSFEYELYNAFCSGVFAISSEALEKLKEYSVEIYLGEVAGKHSEVYFKHKNDAFDLLSTDFEKIVMVAKVLGTDLSNGIYEGDNYVVITGQDPFGHSSEQIFSSTED